VNLRRLEVIGKSSLWWRPIPAGGDVLEMGDFLEAKGNLKVFQGIVKKTGDFEQSGNI
jgi:hypothetical protein